MAKKENLPEEAKPETSKLRTWFEIGKIVLLPKKKKDADTLPKKKTNKLPNSVALMFTIILVVALVNVVNGLGASKGIRPFGFLDNIAHALGIRPASNTGAIVNALKGEDPIEDSFDRCNVIDPNVGVKQVKDLNEAASFLPAGANTGGINVGSVITQGNDIALSYGEQKGMSFIVSIAVSDDETSVQKTIQFIKDANNAGMLPIVRLCYPGACSFNISGDANSIINFFEKVSLGAGNNQFVAILGPNEPGTGGEMQSFGVSDYGLLIKRANEAAIALQNLRVTSGGNMYLAPAAFNLTNADNDDAKNYLGGTGGQTINPSLFDYILGNTYDGLGAGRIGYTFYTQTGGNFDVKTYVDSNNLKMIFTETGTLTKDGFGDLKKSVIAMCQDIGVDGYNLFRSFAALESIEPKPRSYLLSEGQVVELLNLCPTGAKRLPINEVDLAWASCDYDSCLYDDKYDAKSTSRMCGKQLDDKDKYKEDGAGYGLKVKCTSGGCFTEKMDTVEVSAPIKQFGNNSVTGTPTHPFTPLCAEIANALSNDSQYDALNQFAGTLKSKSKDSPDYPMPWLGNALNCAINLIEPDFNLNVYQNQMSYAPSKGSLVTQTQEEVASKFEKEFAGPAVVMGGAIGSVIDERRICNGSGCIEKGVADSSVQGLRDYVIDTPDKYSAPDVCKATQMKYLRDPGNYIIGPEVKLNSGKTKIEWGGAGFDVCFMYAKRSIPESKDTSADGNADGIVPSKEIVASDKISCRFKSDNFTDPQSIVGRTSCQNIQATCDDGRPITAETMQSGTCQIATYKKWCLDYRYKPEDQLYFIDHDYPDVPTYDIPGAYDALYKEYLRLQTKLTARNMKIVFKENVGWKVDVSTKIRDVNRPVGGPGPVTAIKTKPTYGYTQKLSQCSVPADIFNNEYYLGIGTAEKTQYEYYDWLGYVDTIQEWMMTYVNNNTFSAESFVENPYKAKPSLLVANGSVQPTTLKDQELLLKSGTAALDNSFPLYSCDDVEVQKFDSRIPAKNRIPGKKFLTCVTYSTDNRFQDDLATFLCKKGYTIPGVCDASICKSSNTTVSTATTPNTTNPDPKQTVTVNSGTYSATCPAPQGVCLEGPHTEGLGGTHNGLDAIDFTSPTNTLVAPFPGKVVQVWDGRSSGQNYCIGGTVFVGIGLFYQGIVNGQTVTLFIYHLSPSYYDKLVASMNSGKQYNTGELIAPMAKLSEVDNLTCRQGPENIGKGWEHIHIQFAPNSPSYYPLANAPAGLSITDFFYGAGCQPSTGLKCEATGVVQPPDACNDPNDPQIGDPGVYPPGTLACNINLTNTGDSIDWSANVRQIEARIEAYNLDTKSNGQGANQSYTWLANPVVPENSGLKQKLINFLGSEAAYNQDRADRLEVTNYFVDQAKARGINPRFAFTLWVEESAGSGYGGWALGCGLTYLPQIPYGQGKAAIEANFIKQLDCLKSVIDKTNSFDQFMCTYSGEAPLPGTSIQANGVRDCDTSNFKNNPNFPVNICSLYNYNPL